MNYLNGRERALIHLLAAGEIRSAATIAKDLKISEKTVRTLIKGLSPSCLRSYGVEIIVKRGQGFCLKILDDKIFQSSFHATGKDNYLIPETQEERVDYLLYQLISSENGIKLNEICGDLFITFNTIKSDLKKVGERIEGYHLQLTRVNTNSALKLIGSEYDLRLCAVDLLYKNSDKLDLDAVTAIVLNVFDQYQFKMSDIATEQFVKHLLVSVLRIQGNHIIDKSMMKGESEEYMPVGVELEISSVIAEEISAYFHINFPIYEIQYMAIHLVGKRLYEDDGTILMDDEISQLISDVFEIIKQTFDVDFTKDLELRVLLYYHFKALVKRLQFGLGTKNPLLEQTKENHSLAFVMARAGATVIQNRYQRHLSDDEIGYIALSLELSMKKEKEKNRIKKNVILVCRLGKISSELLRQRYLDVYEDCIGRVETCSLQELKTMELSEFDYIFTTVPIGDTYPLPIIGVGYFSDNEEIKRVKKVINEKHSFQHLKYFSEELFISPITAKSKEEAIRVCCDQIQASQIVGGDLYESVLARERAGATDLCYMSAMPHPCENLGNKTCVCVGILNKPIKWETKKVQLIFLIIPGKEQGQLSRQFYRMISKFLLNRSFVKRLIKNKDYPELLNMMESIAIQIEKEESTV